MKGLLSVILVLTFQSSFGQNYLGYYTQINQARLLAANSSFKQSALLYQRVFQEYDFEFARDCINAFEVSSFMAHDTLTSFFIRCALKRGVPISYFSKSQKLEVFRTTSLWSSIVRDSTTLRKEYHSHINFKIRAEINEMFQADQAVRKQFYHWSNLLLRPFIGRKWEKLNHEQVKRIIEITQEHGFPGEKLIGIDMPEHHEKIHARQFSAGMPIIILMHHYSQANESYDSVLFAEVFKGYLHNEHFAGICDYEAEFGKGKHDNFGHYGLRHSPVKHAVGEFDRKREEIGLLSGSEIQILNNSDVMTKYWNWLK